MSSGSARNDLQAARDRQSRADLHSASPIRRALAGRCPNCGRGPLFQGFLKVRPDCAACGHDLAGIHTGDGAASFIMQIAGFVVGFSALYVEIAYHPPMWLHLMVWLPLVAALSLALMRPGKALMIGLQFRNRHEGRMDAPMKDRA